MKTIKYIAAFLPLASLLVSCNDDFLDRYPQDSVTNETYWKTEEQLRAALYPCYETFEYELLIKWAESTAETVIWGDKNMLIPMGSPLLRIGDILTDIFTLAIIS